MPSVTRELIFQVRGDDYGEFINLEDFDVSALKDENKENIDLQIPFEDDDMMGEKGVTGCGSYCIVQPFSQGHWGVGVIGECPVSCVAMTKSRILSSE